MSASLYDFRLLQSQLILCTPKDSLSLPEANSEVVELVQFIAQGEAYKVLQNQQVSQLLLSEPLVAEIRNDSVTFNTALAQYATQLNQVANKELLLIIAISALQMFLQNNYTGPQVPLQSFDYFYDNTKYTKAQIQLNSVKAISAYGQAAYQECEDAFWLLLALHLFEKLSDIEKSLLQDLAYSSEELVGDESRNQIDLNDPFAAAVNWWRSRAVLIQQSLYPELSGPHIAVSSSILNLSVIKALSVDLPEKLQKDLSITYYLEKAKNSLDSNMEHLALPNLINVQKLTNFEFVLTGGRAKRTKYQQTAHAGLIVLARSNYFNKEQSSDSESQVPETFDLDSDLLLERPVFENVGQEEIDDQIYKKQKTDFQEIDYTKILPVALRQEYIPDHLKALDPNNQPNLSDYDNIQLLLRLYNLRQISPANDSLVEEQLMALVSRVLYQNSSSKVNYSIFSRSLWERSILETLKARTIERGILQMQSLVEEIGLKIKARYIPTETIPQGKNNGQTQSNARLRYIFQLPALPRWSLDTKLAEKFMSLGIVKSAIEIYERLNLDLEVALCHAAIGEENVAIEIVSKRLEKFPDDARATSIMGDLKQDPTYWEKAWDMAKYAKAKISLGKYYYSPPKGVEKNLELAIKHIHEALVINPVSFDNWFFYGCLGLESQHFELAAEAFTRCVSIDDTNSNSWSNLATSLLRLNKTREAFNALKKATGTSDNKRSWRLWENYLIVAAKLGEWDEVLYACKKLVDVKKDSSGEGSVDIPVVEKLVEILVSQEYNTDELTFFQKSCIEFTTITLPNVINSSSRLWRIIARVELWRKRPWASLECHEKAFRALTHNPDLETNETVWNETVDACSDLVAAYESLGELPGKYNAGDVVCKDWKYKAKSTVKSLMSKGRMSWEDSEGWERLDELKASI